jgi:GNAT superfamily N-acetyltransferase
MSIRVEAITGDGLKARLGDLARLRIEVFFDYPYLYDGDLAYETKYLTGLGASPNAIIAGAFDGDTIVGAATGAPLADQAPEIVVPFTAQGFNVSDYFYFGESVLRRDYRGQGIGVRFFELREAQARRVGAKIATFCSVVRAANHPRRPSDHVSLDAFWTHRGYAPVPGLQCRISWKELGEADETPKAMQFWQKRLS